MNSRSTLCAFPLEETHFATAEEIIGEARAGRMFILTMNGGATDGGELVLAASFATPQAVNFMATHGRGLIRLALTASRIDALGLPMMNRQDDGQRGVAPFTVSIEAREGVSSGISAFDRARTIRVASEPGFGAQDIATPGHVFPLRACDGGVLAHAGPAEAGVDICRLAGLTPAAVICEVLREDGELAQGTDVAHFAAHHALKIGRISDLIRHRHRNDGFIRMKSRQDVSARWGAGWTLQTFEDLSSCSLRSALVKGDLTGPDPVLVSVQALDPLALALQGPDGETAGRLSAAVAAIDASGPGAVLLAPMASDGKEPSRTAEEELSQGRCAELLAACGIRKIRLLTDPALTLPIGPGPCGIEVVGVQRLVPGAA